MGTLRQGIGLVLDRMVLEKEISAGFFGRMADQLEGPEQRRWFRRLGQDEKDQRKILMKHRREICGPGKPGPETPISPVHERLREASRGEPLDWLSALRLVVKAAEQTRDLCARASDVTPDRSCRIFLKILAEESEAHRGELFRELRREERERLDSMEEAAA